MKSAIMKSALAAIAVVTTLVAPAFAQSVRLIGEFRSWTAYSATEQTGAVCFALTQPTEVTPQPDGFTQAYLYLTHRPALGVRNELNLVAGFNFAADTPATASVGGQSFDLFTSKDAAWLKNPSENDNLASALRAGSTVVIEGTTDAGIKVVESFSLSGATAASRAIEGDCAG
jgi:hypothetical protein